MPQKRVMRVLKQQDLDAVVAIDEMITDQSRRDYFVRKFDDILDSRHNVNSSIVCEVDGQVVGYIMGDVYFGEFGIPETSATIDSLGVHPNFQQHGIAGEMLEQFMMNMKAAGVKRVYTLVNWDDFALEKFFSLNRFVPSKRMNLECQLP